MRSPFLPALVRRHARLIIWVLIALAGGAAGWYRAQGTRAALVGAALRDAAGDAAAFQVDEMKGLTGTPADLANPVYLSLKARLAGLLQADPRVRSVCIVRFVPSTGRTVLLADSESPDSRRISNPGDDYGPGEPRSLAAILGGRLPAVVGPRAEAAGVWVTGYAPVGGGAAPPREGVPIEIVAREAGAGAWPGDMFLAGLQTAVTIWLVLGLPFGGLLVERRLAGQRDFIRKLSQAIEQSRSAVVITDFARRIDSVNAGLCAITGWRRDEMLGQPVQMLASGEATEAQYQEIFAAGAAGRTWSGEIVNRRRDGSTYPARTVASPVYGNTGRLAHIIIVIDDVTERKQVEAAMVYAKERAEAGERAKGQFLAMMGHEIRTPLNGIIGFTSLLLDTPLTSEQAECVRTIRDSGESLLQLTNDVLDYSKIDAGRLSLELQPCNVLECVEAAFEILAARAGEKHLDLLHSVVPGVPPVVLADMGRLRQVLVNLVGNAVKFTAAGEIEVTVQAEPLPGEPGGPAPAPGPKWLLTFAVRDTGIGIPAEFLGRLFKPFSQVDSSSTRKFGGVGLGLAISRSLVQMMGGDISVQSEVGRGTTFGFGIVAAAAPGAAASPGPADPAALRGCRIAVAGGSAAVQRELAGLVEAWGAQPVLCARERLAAQTWDTAVIDLPVAEADPWRLLLAERPELPTRPMVALIPVDFPTAQREALRGGFRAMMRKPPRHEALRALLAASLRPGHLTGLPFVAGSRSPDGLGLRVLLVEDNPVNQLLTQKMLENLGCHWDLAEDGRLALARLESGTYDLVLLDLHLPEVDGYAVIGQIRRGQAGERNRQIPIVAFAADAQEAQRLHTMNTAISDCLARPFTSADLEDALRRSVGKASRPESTGS